MLSAKRIMSFVYTSPKTKLSETGREYRHVTEKRSVRWWNFNCEVFPTISVPRCCRLTGFRHSYIHVSLRRSVQAWTINHTVWQFLCDFFLTRKYEHLLRYIIGKSKYCKYICTRMYISIKRLVPISSICKNENISSVADSTTSRLALLNYADLLAI